jgi:hypothetical protein
MKRLRTVVFSLAALTGLLRAEPLPATSFTVIPQVESFEHYRALGGTR